jgi:hypothetical protein
MANDENRGKTKVGAIYEDSADEYDIDNVLKKELAEQNLEYRFIDFKQARLNGGRSRAGWIVYRRKSSDPRIAGIEALQDPDGLVRNGSMVLAVKTKQGADRQRARRDAQTRTMNQYNKQRAQELNQEAKRLGGNTRILAGYEKNS